VKAALGLSDGSALQTRTIVSYGSALSLSPFTNGTAASIVVDTFDSPVVGVAPPVDS
jgi:hypothetical protein